MVILENRGFCKSQTKEGEKRERERERELRVSITTTVTCSAIVRRNLIFLLVRPVRNRNLNTPVSLIGSSIGECWAIRTHPIDIDITIHRKSIPNNCILFFNDLWDFSRRTLDNESDVLTGANVLNGSLEIKQQLSGGCDESWTDRPIKADWKRWGIATWGCTYKSILDIMLQICVRASFVISNRHVLLCRKRWSSPFHIFTE